jgi:hypothetical protein
METETQMLVRMTVTMEMTNKTILFLELAEVEVGLS